MSLWQEQRNWLNSLTHRFRRLILDTDWFALKTITGKIISCGIALDLNASLSGQVKQNNIPVVLVLWNQCSMVIQNRFLT